MKSDPQAIKKLCIEYRNSKRTNAEMLIQRLKSGSKVSREILADNILTWMGLIQFVELNLIDEDAYEMADNLIASFIK